MESHVEPALKQRCGLGVCWSGAPQASLCVGPDADIIGHSDSYSHPAWLLPWLASRCCQGYTPGAHTICMSQGAATLIPTHPCFLVLLFKAV